MRWLWMLTKKKHKEKKNDAAVSYWSARSCPACVPEVEAEDWCVSWVQESVANICVLRWFSGFKMETFNKLKQFDAYPKTLEDFRVKTWGGATGERLLMCPRAAAVQRHRQLAAPADNKANCFIFMSII